jgi:CBS domain containing-hemolysin-like protein
VELLAGFILTELGRLARPGDVVAIGEWDATVEDVRARRVGRVRMRRRPQP